MAKSGKKVEEAAKDPKTVDGILEKYRKVRQRRKKSESAWKGPSHQKFSQYFDDSSSESETEDRKQKPISSASEEGSQPSGESSTEAMSDSDDSLILPTQKEVTLHSKLQLKTFAGFSDSEPEDPEKEKILQEKLKERRSRVGNPNPSNVSVARQFHSNRTLNLTSNKSKFLPTRLSEVSPNLLDLSSSNDEDEVPFTRKTVEPNLGTEANASFQTPKKRKTEDGIVEFPIPENDLNPDDADPVNMDFAANHELETTPVSQEITKSAVKVSPKKINVNEEHLQAKNLSVSGAVKNLTFQASPDKEVTFTVDEKVRSTSSSSKKRLHVSTPKPKDLPASKLLNNSKRRSYNSATAKKRAAASSNKTNAKISPSKRASAPPSSIKFLSKSKLGNLVAADAEPISSTSDDVPLMGNMDHAVTSTPLGELNLTSKKISDPSKVSKKQSIKKRSKSLAKGNQEIQTKTTPRRTLRSSLSRSIPQPAPMLDASPKSSTTNANIDSHLVSTEPAMLAQVAVPSFNAPITTGIRNAVSEMNVPSRFMACSRIAFDEDPVQSYIIHQTPTLFTIMWKLLPDMCNWARTRGQTCILVFEGEIEVANEVYQRGHVVKLTSDTTYLVKNIGKSVALFQVAEYL